jgi:molecular chaperone GrpE
MTDEEFLDSVADDQSAQPAGQEPLSDLEQARDEAKRNLDGWQRAQADFENFKRRKEAEQQELIIFAREVVVAKLLPTFDTLTQALRHAPDPQDPELVTKYEQWQTGLSGTIKQIDKVLAELGVEKVPAVGHAFDPHKHEAVREVDGEVPGQVVEELQTGYQLNGKVIRPAQVVITK